MRSLLLAKLVLAACLPAMLTHCSRGDESNLRHGIDIDEDKDSWGGAVPITGGWLTYHNARVRCDYNKDATDQMSYVVTCYILANINGNEVKAQQVSPDVGFTWENPKSIAGASSTSDCSSSDKNLIQTCKVQLASENAKVEFGLKVSEKNAASILQTRTEKSVVVFPFYVGVAAGFVPSLPLYRSVNNQPTYSIASEIEAVPAGFQNIAHDKQDMALQANDLCATSEHLYVTDGNQIHRIDSKGKVEFYAGSLVGNKNDFSSRQRIQFNPDINPGIFCTDKGLYVADQLNHRILFVSHEGPVKLIAGTGEKGYSGDGGPALQAMLNEPFGLYLHKDGTLYFTDTHNRVIRKIDSNGVIQTVAGNGESKVGKNGPALETSFRYPERIAYDTKTDRLLVTDYYGNSVWAIKDGMVNLIAGNPSLTRIGPETEGIATSIFIKNPTGVAVTSSGLILVTDYGAHRIYAIDQQGMIKSIVGTGEGQTPIVEDGQQNAMTTPIQGPNSIVVTPNNQIFFSENQDSGRLRQLYLDEADLRKTKVELYLGQSSNSLDERYSRRLQNPLDFSLVRTRNILYSPDGQIFIVTPYQVHKVNDAGELELIAGMNRTLKQDESNGDGGRAEDAIFRYIYAATFDKAGNLFLADSTFTMEQGSVRLYSQIRRISLDSAGKLTSKGKIVSLLNLQASNSLYASEAQSMTSLQDGSILIGSYAGYISRLSKAELSKAPGTMNLSLVGQLPGPVGDMAGLSANEFLALTNGYQRDKLLFKLSLDSGNASLVPDELTSLEVDKVHISNIERLSNGSILTSFLDDRSAGVKTLEAVSSFAPQTMMSHDYVTPTATADCGGGRMTSYASREGWKDAFLNSLGIVCFGNILKIATHDTCQTNQNGSIKLAILQEFAYKRQNVVEIIRPCTVE